MELKPLIFFLCFIFLTAATIFPQRQVYLLYDHTLNRVVGHNNDGYVPQFNFNTGIGYRSFRKGIYSLGTEINLATSNIFESREKTINTLTIRRYTNDVHFMRLNVPFNLQVHRPGWYYGIGIGSSFLLRTRQKETFDTETGSKVEKINEYNSHSFPAAELFFQISGALSIFKQLDISLFLYQGINDIGHNYSWQKNSIVGTGFRYYFNRKPEIIKRPLFSANLVAADAKAYLVLDKTNIIRDDIRFINEGPNKVLVRLSALGSVNRILSVDVSASSGESLVSGNNIEILRPVFPIFATVRFMALDISQNSTFECLYRFEIYKDGHWEVFLQY
jgi:hypothetical protein